MRKTTSGSRARPPYKVGKSRPPESSRFKPGQSGNPKGRPKGSKNLDTIFAELMNKKVVCSENGKNRKISVREGMLRRLIQEALNGNSKVILQLLEWHEDVARKNVERRTEIDINSLSQAERERWAAESYLKLVRAG
jgi:Family of unknown function (DUF5681)